MSMQTKKTAIDSVIARAISASPERGCTGSATKKNHPAAAISRTNKARRMCNTIKSPTLEFLSLYLPRSSRSIQTWGARKNACPEVGINHRHLHSPDERIALDQRRVVTLRSNHPTL